MKMEGVPKGSIAQVEEWAPEDIKEELAGEPELFRYLQLLPTQLWEQHFHILEKIAQEHRNEDKEAVEERRINYLLGVIEAREQALEDFEIRDPSLREIISTQEKEFGDQLRELLVSQGHVLGTGQTARVKSMQVEGFGQPIAVKYLLTPTAKTLSAQGEYDMVREVETISKIEHAEEQVGAGKYIRVPHPFFFYKSGKL